MALVGLEDVEWDKMSHAYGSAKDIPDLLRALDAAETKEEFDRLYRELVVRVNHQGDIYDSTAPTVAYLLQILDKTTSKEKHLVILSHFGGLVRDIQYYPMSFFNNPVGCSVVLLRNNIATYDAILGGLEHYLAGITANNDDIRLASLYILFALKEQYDEILPNLVQTIDKVDDGWFQACIVWTYANIAKYEKYGHQRTIYHQELNRWLRHANPLVRYAAAFGKLRLYMPSPKGNDLTVETIAEALRTDIWSTKGDVSGDEVDMYMELTPFWQPIDLVSKSSRLPDLWIAILKQLEPTPQQAHVCVCEILKLAFAVKNAADSFPKWTNFEYVKFDKPNIVYSDDVSPERYDSSRTLAPKQILALQAIVDCEPFWEIPTNLFSFFYGLPDDREELRKLAEAK